MLRREFMVNDDIDGKEGAETHILMLDGKCIEIDLASFNFGNLQRSLKKYFDHGRSIDKPAHSTASTKRNDLGAVREWARANGYDVKERGRISTEIVQAFDARNSDDN